MVVSNQLNVLLVIDSLGSGGAQRQMTYLAQGLAGRGHKVEMFIYHPDLNHFEHELEEANIRIIKYRKKSRLDPGPIRELRRLVNKNQYDAAVSFLRTPGIYTVLATLGAGTRSIVSERAMFHDDNLPFSLRALYQTYRFADVFTVNSRAQRDQILRLFPWSESKLVPIWNAVNLSRFQPRDEAATSSGNQTRLLAAGTIVSWKNASSLIRGLKVARERGADVTVDWAGRVLDSLESKAERTLCDDLVNELQMEAAWRWLGVQRNMSEVYGNYDALVHPSFREGVPNVVCEAMASGLPVLASDSGDHPLLIDPGINGYLFSALDPESIADAIVQFHALNVDERTRLGVAARRFAESAFNPETYIDQYERAMTAPLHKN